MGDFWLRLSEPYQFPMDQKYLIPTALRKERRANFQQFYDAEVAKGKRNKVAGFFTGRPIATVPIGSKAKTFMREVPPVMRRYLNDDEHIQEPASPAVRFGYRVFMSVLFAGVAFTLIWSVANAA